MTRIRASCPACGEVDLRPDEVSLHLVRAPDGIVRPGSSYRFNCPDCDETVTKPADERIAQLLTTGGVPVEELDDPIDDRPEHPEHPVPGPPLTYDDLLDLHLILQDEDWFDRLAATTR